MFIHAEFLISSSQYSLNMSILLPKEEVIKLTHHPIILCTRVEMDAARTPPFRNLKYRSVMNYRALRKSLTMIDWSPIHDEKNCDRSMDMFEDIIMRNISRCTTKIRIHNRDVKRKPWITNGIVKSINNRKQIFKQIQRQPHNVELKNYYRKYRNKINYLIQLAKKSCRK